MDLFHEFFQQIQSLMRARTATSSGMRQLLDFWSAHDSSKVWRRFARIDYDLDVRCMKSWIPQAFGHSPSPFPIRGLWFGIGQFTDGAGDLWLDLGVRATGQYDPDDGGNAWLLGGAELEHVPGLSAAQSRSVRRIHEIADANGGDDERLGPDTEYPLCYAFCALALGHILAQKNVRALVAPDDIAGVVLGFEDTDFLLLGELTRAEFRVNLSPSLSWGNFASGGPFPQSDEAGT